MEAVPFFFVRPVSPYRIMSIPFVTISDMAFFTAEQLDKIHEYAGNPDVAEKYNAEDAKKDTAIVYAQAGVNPSIS